MRVKPICAVLLLSMVIMAGSARGQGVAPPSTLVSIPTAGTLERGQYEMEVLMMTDGGILGRLGIGFTDRFALGMSYGIQEFIGNGEPSLNRTVPEAQVKYRIYDESYNIPAIALGLDTQGRGKFQSYEVLVDSLTDETKMIERYEVKAIGIFLVASKNWQVWGNFGSHFGISKNVWEEDKEYDDDFNIFFGIDKDLSPELSLYLEYNAALDDNNYNDNQLLDLSRITIGRGKGFLNAGVRWFVTPSMMLEVDLNDIFINKEGDSYFSRELKLIYTELF
ncbi:hypothetical protein ACFL6Q_01385 [Candidatus Neomarinimicrobiota bacterium]